MKTIFAVVQTPERHDWKVVQRENGDMIKTTYHSSKKSAINSIAARMVGITQFAIVVSDEPVEGK